MALSTIDIVIILLYLVGTLGLGMWIANRAKRNMKHYFLGGKSLPWYYLGLSNASGMFDISGTMWLVSLLFIYGLKSIYIPWVWPTFNQIFLMVFLSIWLRRSGVMTGAEWILFRFGETPYSRLGHFIVVAFALISVTGFLAYGFVGIGKFAAVFLPFELSADPHTNEIFYGLIFTGLTTIYVVKGGMTSVVATEVLQFIIMTIASIAIGIIAMVQVSPEMLAAAIPDGWASPGFGWVLEIDWSERLAAANTRIEEDGYSLFGIFMMLVLFKGILVSMAGPAPNYDMQRVLSAKTPVEAAKMSWFVNVVLVFPRYMMIAGLTILALVFFTDELNAMGDQADFEQILPFALGEFLPAGLLGLVIAGLLASFMSTFAATTNAAPAYLVNDIYKRYLKPQESDGHYIKMSYAVSFGFVILGTLIGLFIPTLNQIILWLVSALWGGYTAANLFKWYWWRFNASGFFWGMLTGVLAAMSLVWVDFNPLYAFPGLFLVSVIGCLVGTFIQPADDMKVLKHFYKTTRPWGFWGPVIKAFEEDKEEVVPNTHFARDMFNVTVGIIWQASLTATPIFMVMQYWSSFAISAAIVIVTSLLLKVFWWGPLHRENADDQEVKNEEVTA